MKTDAFIVKRNLKSYKHFKTHARPLLK